MRLKEIMTSQVEIAYPDWTLREAAEEMVKADVGVLPVSDGRRIVGILTDRDITARATAAGKDPNATFVHEAMTRQVICCREDDPVTKVADVMADHKIRRVVVLDGEGRLSGIVSLADLARKEKDGLMTWDVLHDVTEPTLNASTLEGPTQGPRPAPGTGFRTRTRATD